MATPRRKDKDKVRDADATKKRLVEVVGMILRQEGHHGLRTNNIARYVGRNKNVIRHHFGGLNNLLRRYVQEKDYWMPFFERFQLPDSASVGEVKEMFIQLMQENLTSFASDQEMQQIIRWQISQENALMKSISEERELEGDKLFALADPVFEGSGLEFRALIALLLGGSYYISMQAGSNGSRVCGIDIKQDRGLKVLKETIGLVISWAFRIARENQIQETKSTSIMNDEFENLKYLACQRMAGEAAASDPELAKALAEEVRRVEKVMLDHLMGLNNQTQISTYLKISLYTLVKVCDDLYRQGDPVNADAALLLDLMDSIRLAVSDYIPGNIMLPKLFRMEQGKRMRDKWTKILSEFRKSEIDGTLLEIAGIPFKRFLQSPKRMYWSDFKYLRKYVTILEQLAEEGCVSDQELVDELVGLGYNHARFLGWYTLDLQKEMAGKEFAERELVLKRHKMLLRQVPLFTNLTFNGCKLHPVEELGKWVDAELLLQSEQVSMEGLNPLAMSCQLKSEQLVSWQRLQQRHGVYGEADELRLFKKVAFNFRAVDGKVLEEGSFASVVLDAEQVAPLEPVLVAMLAEVRALLN